MYLILRMDLVPKVPGGERQHGSCISFSLRLLAVSLSIPPISDPGPSYTRDCQLSSGMDSLCESCEELLREDSRPGHKVAFGFQSWSRNALTSACHLCTLLFHSAAGADHKGFISNYTDAKYEISCLGQRITDTNRGNYKYLAIAEQLGHGSQRSKLKDP